MDIIANGIRLQYIESGSGYPVVCIPGNGLSTDMWRHLIPELSQRYRAIAYELRGMGKSEAPGRRGVTYTNEDHGKDLEALLDVLDISQAAIVAHAFGGFVAMRVAIDRPERVSTMVLVNTSAKMESPTVSKFPGWATTVEMEGMEPLLDGGMARWFVERVHREHPEVIQLYREMLGANPPMGYAANARGIPLLDIRNELNTIQCPTLVVAGKEDKATPPEEHEIIAERIPGARLVVVPNTSHTVPEEQAEEFNRATLEFLDQNIPRTLL